MSLNYNTIVNQFQFKLPLPQPENLESLRLSEINQRLEETYQLGLYLCLSDLCILRTIHLARTRTVFIEHEDRRFDLRTVCLTSMFLACKCEEIPHKLEDIYKHAPKVLKPSIDKPLPDFDTFQRHLIDCGKYLIEKLDFEKIFSNPYKCIAEIVEKIPNDILIPERKDELTRLANLFVKGCIAIKPVCIKYTPAVIGYFCVKLAMKVQEYNFSSNIWLKDQSTLKQVENLMTEYSWIFSKYPRLFREGFDNEQIVYWKVIEITVAHVASLNGESISNATPNEVVPPPQLSLNDTTESSSTALSATSSEAPHTRHVPIENISRGEQLGEQMETNKILDGPSNFEQQGNKSVERKHSGDPSGDNSDGK